MYWLVNAICDPADPYAGDLKKKSFNVKRSGETAVSPRDIREHATPKMNQSLDLSYSQFCK
jgi:hypothetical protein